MDVGSKGALKGKPKIFIADAAIRNAVLMIDDVLSDEKSKVTDAFLITKRLRFLYKGIIINHNKKLSQPTLKRRFFKKKAAFFSWPGLGKEWC